MEGCVKLPLTKDRVVTLVYKARDYAVSHGLVMRTKDQPETADVVAHVPITLYPTPVPRACFQQAQAVQKDFNLLMHKIAYDYDFLKECLKSAIKVDDYTRRLWNIYETVRLEGIEKSVSLAMNRSDYVLDCRNPDQHVSAASHEAKEDHIQIKQIEFNTMASSFGGLCQKLRACHKYILEELDHDGNIDNFLPENTALEGLAEAVVTAWQQYANPSAVVLFLVSDIERNIYDQRWLEYAIYEQDRKVRVIRRSLRQLQTAASLTQDRKFMVDGLEVAVVYQRAGYTPQDFDGEKDWETRLMMERSQAIVCPSVGYHLAGTKKVQQVLAQPAVVERYISDPEAAARIRATFTHHYSLDLDEEGDKAVAMAMSNPEQLVLKPQREGGGNNTFGSEIRDVLSPIRDSQERTAYVLMERIHPLRVHNYPVRSDQPVSLCSMVSELGIFGTLVGSKDHIVLNKQQGHILRTKVEGTHEGGVAAGFAVLDTPYVV